MPHLILKHFKYDHLPAHLQRISSHFHSLATSMDSLLPEGPEKSVALRKILEGKDAAVRSFMELPPEPDLPKVMASDE